jgi:disulfide bond formation protein DsbB
MIKEMFSISPNRLLIWVTLISVFVVGIAYIMETQFGVLSCKLCVFERMMFIITGLTAFLTYLFFPPRLQSVIIFIIGMFFFMGAGIALYHVAIQHHWVELPMFCNTNDFTGVQSVQALKELLLKTPFVRCDQVTWSFMGISLAGYNALLSLYMTFVCWGWVRYHVMDETIKK